MMRALAALAASTVLGACGGSSAPPPVAPVAQPPINSRQAERDAKSLVVEIYEIIGRGRTDSLFSLLTDPMTVFGPRKLDAALTRSDALVALSKVIDPKTRRPTLRSAALDVVTSPGGRSAWMFDVVGVSGQSMVITAVLSNNDDIWAVTAATIAEIPNATQLKTESAKDTVVPPGSTGAGKLDPSVGSIVEQFRAGLVEQYRWGDELASRSDGLYVGPAAGDVVRGKQALKRRWANRVDANTRAATTGEVTAGITSDAQLVWLSVPVTRVADNEEPLPLRMFAIYERDSQGFKMIALHEAVAIAEPGSGAPFKKILPPAPPAPEPPPEPKVEEPTKQVTKAGKAGTKKKAATKKKKPGKKKKAGG